MGVKVDSVNGIIDSTFPNRQRGIKQNLEEGESERLCVVNYSPASFILRLLKAFVDISGARLDAEVVRKLDTQLLSFSMTAD